MSSVTSWLKVGYHVGKLGVVVMLALPYLGWRMWSAKRAFRAELLNSGVSIELAKSLAASYDRSNKLMVGSLRRGLPSMRRTRVSVES
ncbi:hypothetical protein AUG19_07170 [archaeon 13_1_20CM_2_54_9]|nr:MAG: hypothetical protein AUJ07_07680 [Crenarchaeota archaeon 13_1_40CM_3_53_5]OLE75016.1 MAG: hypothetical protein AUG19_07170 [archaeon 13_1_20CM_2_54_9]